MMRQKLIMIVLVLIVSVAWGSEKNWDFSAPAQYVFETAKIDISEGKASVVQIDQTDDDNSSSGFGGGTFYATTWESGSLQLQSGQTSGSFESRVMDAGGSVSWKTISWTPDAPYYKELPDNASSESAYSEGNANMSGNILLFHMNEDPATQGTTIEDTSGWGNDGSLSTYTPNNGALHTNDGTTNKSVSGPIGRAIEFDGVDDYINTANAAQFTNKVSWSYWIKLDDYDDTTNWMTSIINHIDTDNGFYNVINKTGDANEGCMNMVMRTGGTQYTVRTTTAIGLGSWVHFTFVWDGESNLKIYRNGSQVATAEGISPTLPTSAEVVLARRGNLDGGYLDGDLDEVAIYNRALTDDEVLGNYQGNTTTEGCVLLMHLNEDPAIDNTTIVDSHGANNKSVIGKLERALRFDGIDDYISISPANPVSAISVVAWFKSLGAPAGGYHIIVGPADVEISIPTAGVLRTGITTDTMGRQVFNSGSDLTDGDWHQVGLTYDGSKLTAFIDGAQSGEQNVSGDLSGMCTAIGRYGSSTQYYTNGVIDELAICNRGLSSGEVESLYKRGALKLRYQIRSGSSNPPTGNFIGPDGTTSTYYSELDSNNSSLTPPSNISLTNLSDNRYFQYKTIFETDNSSYSPKLATLEVGPAHYYAGDPGVQPLTTRYQGFTSLSTFEETAAKNGGEIKYVISNDAGSSWFYWNGSWEASDGTYSQGNTASVINTNISSFEVGSGEFLFKAFLHSSGTQAVNLSNIKLDYELDVSSPQIVSYSPASEASNVSAEAKIEVTFDKEMDQNSVESAFSLRAIYDNQQKSINTSVSGTFTWESNSSFVFTPSALSKGYTYQAAVSDGARDSQGNNLATEESWNFTIVFDHDAANIFQSDDGKAKVTISKGALSQDGSIDINRDPENSPKDVSAESITAANNKLYVLGDPSYYPLASSMTEFIAYDTAGNRITDTFSAAVTITLYYNDADNDGYVDRTFPAVRETTLAIYHLDETNNSWEALASTVDTDLNSVTAAVDRFSVYALIPAFSVPSSATDLSLVYAFPVPFRPAAGHTKITFTNLAANCMIKIYSIDGDLVASLNETDGDGLYEWDVTNSGGTGLASGVYFYHIKSDQGTKTGKMVIVR